MPENRFRARIVGIRGLSGMECTAHVSQSFCGARISMQVPVDSPFNAFHSNQVLLPRENIKPIQPNVVLEETHPYIEEIGYAPVIGQVVMSCAKHRERHDRWQWNRRLARERIRSEAREAMEREINEADWVVECEAEPHAVRVSVQNIQHRGDELPHPEPTISVEAYESFMRGMQIFTEWRAQNTPDDGWHAP